MTAQELVFVLLAAACGLAAVAVVTARNLVHAALFLATALGAVAGVFLVLQAEFVAMVQLLIYVGAIAVLLMFGLMLTRAPIGREALDSQSRGLALAVSTALFAVFGGLIWQGYASNPPVPLGAATTSDLGLALFSHWVLPFELASMLLLAALIGAIALSRREAGDGPPETGREQRIAAAGGPAGEEEHEVVPATGPGGRR
ncbi:MAG: NADH-quinone oxidoreductase subunit J [Nitriliruptorales bacterium]